MEISPDLEARFLEQEHRVVRVIQNYFDSKKWAVGDPRRAAARNALLWRLLAPSTAAVATSGLVAGATLVVLIWQTRLIAEQNEFFKEQNQKLQTQIDQQADQDTNRRRTEIIAALYETTPGPLGTIEPRANARTRGEAVVEFVQLERRRLARLQQRVPSYRAELSLTQSRLDGLNLDGTELDGIVLVGAFLQNTSFDRASLQRADLRAAILESTSFREADLRRANFEGNNPLEVSFARGDLREANLTSVGVKGCQFLGADLRGATLTGLRDWNERANFGFANIANVKDIDPALREFALKQGAVEIQDDLEWERFKKEQLRP
jgi:uncharacterized protein YjbI with pentapeptide repeats